MAAGRLSAALGLGLLLAAFAAGAGRLVSLRFEAGDVYPRYSSLRADPWGCRVLHDALAELSGLRVERSFRHDQRGTDPEGSTVLLLGTPFDGSQAFADEEARSLEELAAGGARVVVALASGSKGPEEREPEPRRKPERGAEGRDAPAKPKVEPGSSLPKVGAPDRWGARIGVTPETGPAVWATAARGDVPWGGFWRLEGLDPAWRVVLRRGPDPVLAERPWGSGTLVLATDAGFATNEALRAHRRPELLAWLAGPRGRVVFDEEHLGVQEPLGVMVLARRYRLGGLGAGLLALAGLVLWRTGAGFGRRSAAEGAAAPSGKDAGDALENLLRRSVREEELLGLCLERWKASGCGRRVRADRLRAVEDEVRREAAAPEAGRDPAAAYRRVSRILAGEPET